MKVSAPTAARPASPAEHDPPEGSEGGRAVELGAPPSSIRYAAERLPEQDGAETGVSTFGTQRGNGCRSSPSSRNSLYCGTR